MRRREALAQWKHGRPQVSTRSSSRAVRRRKKGERRALLGDLVKVVEPLIYSVKDVKKLCMGQDSSPPGYVVHVFI